MKKRICPICNSDKKKKIREIHLLNFDDEKGLFDDQSMVVCKQCGFVFHEDIDFDKIDEYYSSYTSNSEIKQMTADELVLNNNMADFVQYNLKTGKHAGILDIGCGYGWVLNLLKDRGFVNVYGVDTDRPLIQKLKETGLQVEEGSIYSQNKEEFYEKFDVITLKMVLEHLVNPQDAIKNVAKWLKKDGIFVIEVPDCSLYDCTAFFPGYFQSVNMEHINNFSAISVMNLMKEWRMAACESTNSQGIFPVLRMAFKYDKTVNHEIIFHKNEELAIIKSLDYPNELGKQFAQKIHELQGKECAIWGVSAYTRGALTYTKLKQLNIRCFVDRNEKLQQKTLMGKPILAPTELDKFDGTIVIVGKNALKAIKGNILELGYKNEIICLSE